ncbi:2OG-Fe(II) oxygenase [Vibrio viridaestus]|uniref:SM-20 protein n=1 Tax=Vibrio viridaestus TaxID=2487322 RepID=A0A3N9TM66_9VIBR|nr:2OG-Fe(II) oxygenase [Vibrio viridaestus]RQW65191.1 SM-20 protein [Vibrio viridaestus]
MDRMIDQLADVGWYVWDDFLSHDEVIALKSCLPENWKPAGIGRDDQHTLAESVRRDEIKWIQRDMGLPVAHYLSQMEDMRQQVNRALYLGLFEYEAHFAHYAAGDFYKKHLDAFQGMSNRRLTTVMYLNDEWVAEDAGILKVYNQDDSELMDIEPKGGRLVVFLSEKFPHEVLPSRKDRYSIAGWFRVNGVSESVLDIAR